MTLKQIKTIISIFENTDEENITKVMPIANTQRYLYTYKGVNYSVIVNTVPCYQKRIEEDNSNDKFSFSEWYDLGTVSGQKLRNLSTLGREEYILIKRTVLISMGYSCEMAKNFYFEIERTRIRAYWSHYK